MMINVIRGQFCLFLHKKLCCECSLEKLSFNYQISPNALIRSYGIVVY